MGKLEVDDIAVVVQSCSTLHDPMDYSMPGYPIPHHLPDINGVYTNNKRAEREIKETVPFTITSEGINYLGIKKAT